MKKLSLLTGLIIMVIVLHAQSSSTIKITGTRFPFEIMQQWIDVYTRTHTAVKFQLSKSISTDSAELVIAAHAFRPGELNDDEMILAVNRYAQLPIVNSNRADLKSLQKKGFTKQDLNNIYFNQTEKDFTVYKRNKNVCASRSFAENVTGEQFDVAGILVNGDDRALSAAVKNDINGISYNNLGLIYDLKTRKLADSIAIIPIDLNENGKIDENENMYATLDDVLRFLSTSSDNIIPQDNVNIVINRNTISHNALDFIEWILTKGQEYNSRYGFLNLDKTVVMQQRQLLNSLVKDNALVK